MQFWKDGYKYDMIRHGFKFEEKTTLEQADDIRAGLRNMYGDFRKMNGGAA